MRMTRRIGYVVLAVLAAAFSARAEPAKKPARATTHAAEGAVRLLGQADGWSAYMYKEESGRVCYLAGTPQASEPAHLRRRQPMLMVTQRPQENVADVVSFNEGYTLKPGSNASLDIDGSTYDLFTKGDTAWSRTSDLDRTIVQAMVKGTKAVLQATPQKGPPTTDTYSLIGFSKALALTDKACSVKR